MSFDIPDLGFEAELELTNFELEALQDPAQCIFLREMAASMQLSRGGIWLEDKMDPAHGPQQSTEAFFI